MREPCAPGYSSRSQGRLCETHFPRKLDDCRAESGLKNLWDTPVVEECTHKSGSTISFGDSRSLFGEVVYANTDRFWSCANCGCPQDKRGKIMMRMIGGKNQRRWTPEGGEVVE